MLEQFIDLLKVLVRQPSVVGAEHSFFRVLQRELEERNAQVSWYEGLLVAHGNQPDSLMISAHVNRHGLICTGPNEFQYAAFVAGSRSDLLGNSVSEQMMRKVAGRFASMQVVAYDPWSGAYLGSGAITRSEVCEFRRNLVFEVAGLEHVVAGTPVAFADRLRVAEGLLSAQLDNVLTAAMLVHLFDHGFQGTAFFSAQEEAGRSWRFLLEWFRRFGHSTNRLIVVDTSPYPDRAAADAQQVVLRRRDANYHFDQSATHRMMTACESLGISYSFKDQYIDRKNQVAMAEGREAHSYGSTELGRIMSASQGKVRGATLQIPTTGYHTASESAALASCKAFMQLLLAIMNP